MDAWKPLQGLQILDISTYVAGPSGAMALAHLGADVIRVDPLGGATDTRRLPLAPNGVSLYWCGLNRGKRSVEVDTRTDVGRALVARLLANTGPDGGIVLTNALGQRWLEYDELRQHRPDLIHVHIQGYNDGAPAVDYTVNAEVGLPLITGASDSTQPVNHVLPAWDLLTGLHAAIGILAAVRDRSTNGQGCSITVSLADVAASTMAQLGFVADAIVNESTRLREGNYLYGTFGCDFETADGGRVMVVALTPRHWQRLVAVTGLQEVMAALEPALGASLDREEDRYKHREVLSGLLRPWFARRSLTDVADALEDSGVLWSSYQTVKELVSGENSLIARSTIFVDVEQPGIGRYPAPGSVLRLPGRNPVSASAPELGQHTTTVLAELLGAEDTEILRLVDGGTIASRGS